MVAYEGRVSPGTAANTGNAGSGPSSTMEAWTVVPAPTAKPGPAM